MRKGKELKAPHHTSTVASCNDYIIIYNIIPNTSNFFLWLLSIYKYRLTSVTDINPLYLLLLLSYKSRCPKIC